MVKLDYSQGVNVTHRDLYPIGSVVVFNNNEIGMIVQIAPTTAKLIGESGNRYIDRDFEIVHDTFYGAIRADELKQVINIEKVYN